MLFEIKKIHHAFKNPDLGLKKPMTNYISELCLNFILFFISDLRLAKPNSTQHIPMSCGFKYK